VNAERLRSATPVKVVSLHIAERFLSEARGYDNNTLLGEHKNPGANCSRVFGRTSRDATALKSDTYTDGLYVYAAESVEVRVHYPGSSAMLREAQLRPRGGGKASQRSAEGVVKPSDRSKAQRVK
jgi:hypothetical protein